LICKPLSECGEPPSPPPAPGRDAVNDQAARNKTLARNDKTEPVPPFYSNRIRNA
jgi:hypothetical protein